MKPQHAASSALVLLLALTSCSSKADQKPAESQPATSSASSAATATADPAADNVAVVPGYAPGQFPSVPSIVLPDISVMNRTTAEASRSFADQLRTIPGLKVSPAHCGPNGEPLVGGSVVLGGDGGGVQSGGGKSQVNSGDGAGVYTDAETSLVNNGDGSGVLSRGGLQIVVEPDGSGSYSEGSRAVTLDGKGMGTSTDGRASISISGDGSGTYTFDDVSIVIEADGSGTYKDGKITIVNDGHGSALVNSEKIKADPLPPVPPAGKFPAITKMAPVEPVCGLYITLSSEVLFDYDKSNIRPDAKDTLDKVSPLLSKLPGGTALQVEGHTDAHGSDDYNKTLSEKRAAAVVDALKASGTSLPLTAVGYGESRPVAPNELNGKDNPAGRQLNRRVEIFVPVK